MINKFSATAIFLLIGLCLISSSTIVFAAKVLTKEGQEENEKNTSSKDEEEKVDLIVIVKLNYSQTEKDLPQNYKKVRLDIGKEYSKYQDLSKLPSSIKVKHLDIKVGEKFGVCLNNPKTDDGECTIGNNGKDKGPETVSLKVP
jgi:hypothetical protein